MKLTNAVSPCTQRNTCKSPSLGHPGTGLPYTGHRSQTEGLLHIPPHSRPWQTSLTPEEPTIQHEYNRLPISCSTRLTLIPLPLWTVSKISIPRQESSVVERSFFTRTLSGFLSDRRIEVAEELSSLSGFSTLEVNLFLIMHRPDSPQPDDLMRGSRPRRCLMTGSRPGRRGGGQIGYLTPAQ